MYFRIWFLLLLTFILIQLCDNASTKNYFPLCISNHTFIYENRTLMNAVKVSKLIFSGKILKVHSIKKGMKFSQEGYIFKVYVRRVLKGDVGELSEVINFETRTANSSNRAYVFAERLVASKTCAFSSHIRVGRLALLFADGNLTTPLNLVTDPLPLNAEYVRRVKSVLKGKILLIEIIHIIFILSVL